MNICNNMSAAQKDRPAPLFCRLPGEAAPQPAYIEFDPAARTFTPDFCGYSGGGQPANVFNRLLLRIPVPANASAKGLTRLMASAPFLALGERVIAGFELGGDCDDVGVYSTDADDAIMAMERMAEWHFGDSNMVQVWSAGDYLEPALLRYDDRATLAGYGAITASTTDADLATMAKTISTNAWVDDNIMFETDTDAFDELRKMRDEVQATPQLDKLTPELIDAAARMEDIDVALRSLMEVAGITTGDVAGVAFSGGLDRDTWPAASHDARLAGLRHWIELERVHCPALNP